MWNYKTPGIPDKYFERTENVPITKEEVRTIQISKARLKPGQTVYDIGGLEDVNVCERARICGGKCACVGKAEKYVCVCPRIVNANLSGMRCM